MLASRINALSAALSKHFNIGQTGAKYAVQLAGERGATRYQVSRCHVKKAMRLLGCLCTTLGTWLGG